MRKRNNNIGRLSLISSLAVVLTTAVGVQKGAHTELKHSCKACGDDSAFCCATKPGSGATKGMEKK